MNMDHSEAMRATAKVLAYSRVGKPEMAKVWAKKLIDWLKIYEETGIAPR